MNDRGRTSLGGWRTAFPVLIVAVLILVNPRIASARESVSDLKKTLRAALVNQKTSAAMEAIDGLATIGTASAMDAILDSGVQADDYEVEQFILRRLSKLENQEGLERLCQLAKKHKDFRVRVLLALLLAQRPEPIAVTAVVQSLFDPFDSVALAAVDGLERRNTLDSITYLIKGLQYQEDKGRATGLVAYEIRKALTHLTGLDFTVAADWNNFWKNNKDGFVRPKEETKKNVTSVLKDPPVFFGMEMNSDRLIFVLDVSGSMDIKDPLPEEEGDQSGGRGATGVGPEKKKEKPSQRSIPDSRRRLTRVQKELIEVIDRLPSQTQFNIITFNHKIVKFKDGLVTASGANKSRAKQFVREFKAEGLTHTDEALQEAFSVPNIDSIFLLSDGAPRRNDKLVPVEPILDWVRKENRFRRIRVNSIYFEQGGKSMKAFMRKLARQNHGDIKALQ